MNDAVMPSRSVAAGSSSHEYVDRTLLDALAAMPSGWSVLQEAVLPEEDGTPPTRIGNILVHPDAGIAVLEVVPGPTVSDAAARLRRLLETAGFAATFGGLPPVIHLSMPLRMLPDLGASLDQAFGRLPLLAMRGGGAWVGALQRLLTATALTSPKDPAAGGQAWHSPGLRALAWFWAGVVVVTAGGVAALQYLGPPAGPAVAERQDLATAEAAPALPVQTWQPPPLLLPPMMPGPPESIAALPVSTPEIAWPPDPEDAAPLPSVPVLAPEPEPVPDRVGQAGAMASTDAPAAGPEPIPTVEAAALPPAPVLAPEPEPVPDRASPSGVMASTEAPTIASPAPIPTVGAAPLPPVPVLAPEPEQAPDHVSQAGAMASADAPGAGPEPIPTTDVAAGAPTASAVTMAAPPPIPVVTSEPEHAPGRVSPHGATASIETPAAAGSGQEPTTGSAMVALPLASLLAPEPERAPDHAGASDAMASIGTSAAAGPEPIPTADAALEPAVVSAMTTPPPPLPAVAPEPERAPDRLDSPAAMASIETPAAASPEPIPTTSAVTEAPAGSAGAAALLPPSPAVVPEPERASDRASPAGAIASIEASAAGPEPDPTAGLPTTAPPLAVPPPGDAIATAGLAAGPVARRTPDEPRPEAEPEPGDGEPAPLGGADPATAQALPVSPPPVPAPLPPATASAARVASDASPPQVPPAGAPFATAMAPASGAPASGTPALGAASRPPAAARPAGAGASPSVRVEAYVRRAEAMMALNDVSAARLFYGRAAAAGSGQAMLALGETHDPLFLESIGARGITGDAAVAVAWYRRAFFLGVEEARERLALHGVKPDE